MQQNNNKTCANRVKIKYVFRCYQVCDNAKIHRIFALIYTQRSYHFRLYSDYSASIRVIFVGILISMDKWANCRKGRKRTRKGRESSRKPEHKNYGCDDRHKAYDDRHAQPVTTGTGP
jgi:hypothetical protein